MNEFKPGDRVLVPAVFVESREHGSVFLIRRGNFKFYVVPDDVRPYTEPIDSDGAKPDSGVPHVTYADGVRAINNWINLRNEIFASKAADATHPQPTELQSAIAELGRVTGLSGDDLLHAAAVALQQVASNVVRAAAPYAAARTKAMNDLEWLIGSLGPKVLDHAASPDACGLKGR